MLMDLSILNEEQLLSCATTLETVLNRRTHRRIIMGEDVIVSGSLSKALKLPQLILQLQSPQTRKKQQASEQLQTIWQTLSESTQLAVQQELNWYDPKALDWDDPRSNRNPF